MLSVGNAEAQQANLANVQQGQLTHQGQAYRVVDAASYLSASQSDHAVKPIAFQSCNACGTSCGGRCNGPLGLGLLDGRGCNLSDDGCNYGMVDPCGSCQPFWYGSVEALVLERDGGDDRGLGGFGMTGFDYEWGGRYTIGRVRDCVHGCEVSYTGLFQWDSRGSAADPGFGIDTLLTTAPTLVPGDLSAFNNASLQNQINQAEFWSVEANATVLTWDIAKLVYGVRYMEYDEQLLYTSQNAAQTGALRSRADNQMFGVQVGVDLMYPVCRRGYADFRSRFAGLIDSIDTDVLLVNDGAVPIFNRDDDDQFAGLIELGGGFRYRFGNLSIRAGGEILYFNGLATATGQFQRVVDNNTGDRADSGDDILITGFSLGAQLRY